MKPKPYRPFVAMSPEPSSSGPLLGIPSIRSVMYGVYIELGGLLEVFLKVMRLKLSRFKMARV